MHQAGNVRGDEMIYKKNTGLFFFRGEGIIQIWETDLNEEPFYMYRVTSYEPFKLK